MLYLRTYLIIQSVSHYYRIVSVHKFYIKNSYRPVCFAPVGIVYERYASESAQTSLKLITEIESALNCNCYEVLMIIFYQISRDMLQMKFDKQQ